MDFRERGWERLLKQFWGTWFCFEGGMRNIEFLSYLKISKISELDKLKDGTENLLTKEIISTTSGETCLSVRFLNQVYIIFWELFKKLMFN